MNLSSQKTAKKPGRTKSAKSNSSRLATALQCAKAGLPVAQVYGVKNKHCNCGEDDCAQVGVHLRSPNGIEDAAMEPAEIEALESWSSSRIAIATGVEGLIALVVNGKAPQAALAELLSSAATVQIMDGNSRVYLWKMPPETVPQGRVVLRKGVEVLGTGEYFVAPNDLNTTRGERRFAEGGVIGKTDIAAAPDWLLARLRPHLLGINARPPSPGSERVRFKTVIVDVNCIIDGNDPCDPKEVELRAKSILETGPRMPPAVRLDGGFREDLPLYSVLTDRCQIEAVKSLGATHVECILVDADDDGAAIWQIADLFNQPHKTVLERAELATKCLEIVRRRGGQHAQGDKGMSTAERILGVSRRDLGRFEKIAGILAEAKEAARRAGLDDNQQALLAIAAVPTNQQVQKVRELTEQYAGGRRKPSAATQSKRSAGSSTAAATKKKGVDSKEGPDDAEDAEAEPPTDATEDVEDSDDSEAGADSPPIVPEDDGLGIPPFLRRTDEEKIKAKLRSIYDNYLAPEWPGTPLTLQCWFVTEVLGVAIVNVGKERKPQ